jgi:hypothetical protein
VKLSSMEFTLPSREAGGDAGEQSALGDAEAHFLALHVAAGLGRAGRRLDANLRQQRRAGLFRHDDDRQEQDQQRAHDAVQNPGLPAVADHLAEAEHDRTRQHDHQQRLHQVGDGGCILKRMRGVGIEEAAAIGAQMLDGLKRGYRPECDRLVSSLHRMRGDDGGEGLRLTLLDHQQREHERSRHQHARREADEVTVEIAEIGATVLHREGADERHCDDESSGGRSEHREGDCRHLTEDR